MSSYICSCCGESLEGLPTDFGYRLPDEVFSLTYLEKYERTRHNADLCTLDGNRFFLRGLLRVPFTHMDGYFGWGVWAEVDRETHDFYLRNFSVDNSAAKPAFGRLANGIPAAPELGAEALEIHFQDESSRPEFRLLPHSSSKLAQEQHVGIDAGGHHAYLVASGHFGEDA